MLSAQNIHVLRQFAKEREATLRRTTLLVGDGPPRRTVRRWIGRQLVRTGTWLANDPTMRPIRAR